MQRSMENYPRAAVERAMKTQEVILRAMAKKINWWQQPRSWGSVIDRCDAGGSAMKKRATTV
jgi:hypothetical protein